MKTVELNNLSTSSEPLTLKYCDRFWSKLKGLMFIREIQPNEGIVIVENRPSRMNTSIHMLFMNFDLAVIWLDEHKTVVDKTLAKRWMPAYTPKAAAQYVLELHPSRLSDFSIGDQCTFPNG
ncbi:DUF192 domain-containing protein [bacterium]|nr:DUF192 domain-containing protein [bacterium]